MVVYDFVYINRPKIESLYAQIFSGLLTKTTNTTSNTTKDDSAKGVGYSKTYGEKKTSSSVTDRLNSEIDPHEIITIDTLSTLSSSAKPIEEARNGDIIKINADMFLMDKALFDIMMPNLSSFMMMDAPKSEHKHIKQMANTIRKFFESIRFDPTVFASMENGVAIGNIKEDYLFESITSFHLKHGKDGLSNVYIIGIKEEGVMSFHESEESLINGAMEISEIIKNLIVPEGAYVFTPIAIYREIELQK